MFEVYTLGFIKFCCFFVCRTVNFLLSNIEWTGDSICVSRFSRDRHLCCLGGMDVFLNPFFKWLCCAACPDRWTEDKARLAAWPSPKSSVCSPYVTRRGSCYMMCSSLHSFLVERGHWTSQEGERALGSKYWELHTLQNRRIYSIKMWYLISYTPGCAYLEETQIELSPQQCSESSAICYCLEVILWNDLWYNMITPLLLSCMTNGAYSH